MYIYTHMYTYKEWRKNMRRQVISRQQKMIVKNGL